MLVNLLTCLHGDVWVYCGRESYCFPLANLRFYAGIKVARGICVAK